MKPKRILASALLAAGCGQSLPVTPSSTPTVPALASPSIIATQVPVEMTRAPTQSPAGYALDCGPMDLAECEVQAVQIAEQYGPRLMTIRFTSVHGDMIATLKDGSSVSRIVD